MNKTNTTGFDDLVNKTAMIQDGKNPSNISVAAAVIITLLFGLLIIAVLLLVKFRPHLFPCLKYRYEKAHNVSRVGLSMENEIEDDEEEEEDEETEQNELNENGPVQVTITDNPTDEGYFYDEIFGKSAFTDAITNRSITNLFTIADYNDDESPEPVRVLHPYQGNV